MKARRGRRVLPGLMAAVRQMRLRKWRALLAAGVAAAAVAAGVVVAIPASAGPIESGEKARIAARSIDSEYYCLVVTGELRESCDWPTDLYTFLTVSCIVEEGDCYKIRATIGTKLRCLFYDQYWDKISYGACTGTNLNFRWHIDSLARGGVRLRPASESYMCVVYDPATLYNFADTSIEECVTQPYAHKQFYLVDRVAEPSGPVRRVRSGGD